MDKKPTAEEGFRASLEDIVAITEALTIYVSSVEELSEMCKLAITNSGQAKILLDLVTRKKT